MTGEVEAGGCGPGNEGSLGWGEYCLRPVLAGVLMVRGYWAGACQGAGMPYVQRGG